MHVIIYIYIYIYIYTVTMLYNTASELGVIMYSVLITMLYIMINTVYTGDV